MTNKRSLNLLKFGKLPNLSHGAADNEKLLLGMLRNIILMLHLMNMYVNTAK